MMEMINKINALASEFGWEIAYFDNDRAYDGSSHMTIKFVKYVEWSEPEDG